MHHNYNLVPMPSIIIDKTQNTLILHKSGMAAENVLWPFLRLFNWLYTSEYYIWHVQFIYQLNHLLHCSKWFIIEQV